MDFKILLMVGFLLLVKRSVCANVSDTTTSSQTTPRTPLVTTPPSETTGNPATTTSSPEELCKSKTSCEDCLGAPGAKCLWCKSNNNCTLYPLSKVLPPSDVCALDQARWGVCWLNFEALIIGVSVVGGVIFLTITCCCVYCCCCRGQNGKKIDKDEARYNAQKLERQAKSNERKTERKEKLDEIRRKYGLMKDEPYQRFDA